MGELRITDLVDPKVLTDLQTLNDQLKTAQKNYTEAAQELAKGIKMKVEGIEDLEKFEEIISKGTKKADEATAQYNEAAAKQRKVVEQTTNTISRELGEIEKENKAKREAYKVNEEAMKIAKDILGSRSANIRQLATVTGQLKKNAAEQKKLNDAEKDGSMSTEELINRRAALMEEEQTLKASKAELNKVLNNEVKMNQAAEGSYKQLSLQLELMKKAYKDLNDEEKNGEFGKVLGEEIGKLDAHLKDLSADMGEFQRNVGNYAIGQGQYADTIQDKLFGVLGISEQTGKSLISLGQNGSAGFAMLKTNAIAFFKTLVGFLANPAVLAMLGIGGAVVAFKWIFDYNKGLVESTKLTQQFTGATGDMLKNQRNSVQALADTYDKDFSETLESVNAVANQFGISFDEAFEKIKKGFASGGDVNGEFLDNLKEYPAYFKEAGLSADEFIAITTKANKEGIYSDKGIDVIKEGNLRIREMTKATADALAGIGISSKEVMKGLEEGSLSTFDVMQMVSEKLEEYPESSSAVGTAIADIFGGPGEDAGLQYIKTLHKIDTNLDNVRAKAGKLADLQEEQVDAEIDMQNHLSALFDFTGSGFEGLTIQAKTFVKKGISAIIDGIIKVYNYFIDLYNSSDAFRILWHSLVAQFKNGFDFIGNLFTAFVGVLKATGTVLKSVFTLDWDTFKQGLQKYSDSIIEMAKSTAKDFNDNYAEELAKTQNKLKPITIPAKVAVEKEKDVSGTPTSTGGGKKKGLTAQEAAKEAEERKKIIAALKQSELDLMDEGFAKEMAKMAENHRKRLEEIKGHSAEENKLRANYEALYLSEKQKYEDAYNEQRQRVNLENQIAAAKEGSDELLSLLLEQKAFEHQIEVEEAGKTGADVSAINAKYEAEKQALREEYAQKRIDKIQESYAVEELLSSVALSNEQSELERQYADGLISKEEYEKKKAEIVEKYALQKARSTISMIEAQLNEENLSADQRERLELELAKAKAALEKQMADNMVNATERQKKTDEEATKKRLDNMSKVADALNKVNEMGNDVFEAKLSRLDEEQERVQSDHDAEIERIEHLEETGVISKEEAESRKRAAEEKTRNEEEKIEKQKQKIQQKQAVWNKANQLAQTGIATAHGIMEALAMFPPNIPLAAMIGAMGAVQAATILATPIPKYAKGTDSHPGGPAIVGDGGKPELVMFGGNAWTTPDVPTLVNLPKGAEVLPDVSLFEELNLVKPVRFGKEKDSTIIVNNDNSEVIRWQKAICSMFKKLMVQNAVLASRQETNDYINDKL